MSDSDSSHNHDHHHRHGHEHHSGIVANLGDGDYNPFDRVLRIVVNLARRGRGGHLHDCCGNYGEPGC